uniref:Uncharacterized protein n=1 Tax=Anopheles funestus TaxID=62324 RepID=A0A182S0M6_ANOFN
MEVQCSDQYGSTQHFVYFRSVNITQSIFVLIRKQF